MIEAELKAATPSARAKWLLNKVISPSLYWLHTFGIPDTERARQMLITIALQESAIIYRDQIVAGKRPGTVGPATGFWQFEKGGGVAGVLRHKASREYARTSCMLRDIGPEADPAWRALVVQDDLACIFARLLLWTDLAALPAVNEPGIGWEYYLRNWRPGKPHASTWAGHWRTARDVLRPV